MTTCFLVDSIEEGAWTETGEQRVGAMGYWSHGRSERDTEPKAMPHLAVMTPIGLVCLDCPATSDPPGRYWLRVGEPPLITVSPSLNVNNELWHGWIVNGEMTP